MCGRYYIDQEDDIAEMRQILNELSKRYYGQETLDQLRTGEIFPSHVVPVLHAEPASGHASDHASDLKVVPVLMRWGLAKPQGSGVLINARAETAAQKPFFRAAFKDGRILVPASAFFEWRKPPEKDASGKKQKVRLTMPGQSTFYMAGLSRPDKDSTAGRFAIITTAANPSVAAIHDRQPLILPRSLLRSWILDPDKAVDLLSFYLDTPLELNDVS